MNPILNRLPVTRVKLFIARMLYYMMKPIYGTKKQVIKRNGMYFEVDITEGLDLSLFLFGNFQKHVTENKYLQLPNDAIILDIGANVGIMSLHFARKVPNGKVYAFEPTHYAYQKLKRNIELNPELGSNIQIVQTFVSCETKKNTEIQAFSSWKINKKVGPGQHPVHGGEAMSAHGVSVITLDDFVKDNGIDRLDFIKIDTDGHEYDVLSGARRTIQTFKPQIIFELGQYVMEEKGIEFKDYANYFATMHYKLSNAANNGPITNNNYKKMIPGKGTIDVLALYNSKN